jgi:hypothetical protein
MGRATPSLGVNEALRKEVGFTDWLRWFTDAHISDSFSNRIVVKVRQLIAAGLLQADDPTDYNLERTKIDVTPLLRKIQDGLDFSLTFLATINSYRSMSVEPLFGKPDALVEKLDVFVLMPFKADMLPVYEDHIKPTCASLG